MCENLEIDVYDELEYCNGLIDGTENPKEAENIVVRYYKLIRDLADMCDMRRLNMCKYHQPPRQNFSEYKYKYVAPIYDNLPPYIAGLKYAMFALKRPYKRPPLTYKETHTGKVIYKKIET